MDAVPAVPLLRIGELSRRVGVSEHVLRAWERRYGLLRPVRSPGGFRLYTAADERRVRRMQTHLAAGLSAAEAARATLAEEDQSPELTAEDLERRANLTQGAEALARALDEMDEPAAQALLDRLLADFTVETVLRDVLVPYLRELGERWARGTASVAQEHFASHLLRGRLSGLARGWGQGRGPRALLACPPGEEHDLPLLAFGVVLHRHGWRVDYLGANTPMNDLIRTTTDTSPDLVVLAATTQQALESHVRQLAQLARSVTVAVAGGGATATLAQALGARLLDTDPVTAAEELARRPQ